MLLRLLVGKLGGNFRRRGNFRGGGGRNYQRVVGVGYGALNENLRGNPRNGGGIIGSSGNQFGSPRYGRTQPQQGSNSCHGCGKVGNFVRSCPRELAIGNNRNFRNGGGYFGGQFQSFKGQPPRGGRWVKMRRNFGNIKPPGISAVEEEEEELVWQEDEEEYETLEDNFQQSVNVVEFAENHYTHDEQQPDQEVTM